MKYSDRMLLVNKNDFVSFNQNIGGNKNQFPVVAVAAGQVALRNLGVEQAHDLVARRGVGVVGHQSGHAAALAEEAALRLTIQP